MGGEEGKREKGEKGNAGKQNISNRVKQFWQAKRFPSGSLGTRE